MKRMSKWVTFFMTFFLYPHFVFWWCFETTAGDCSPALLSVHWRVTIQGCLLQKSFPAVLLCVKGGWCQTPWSQLKEKHAMVFGVSLQRTNEWFYVSAFNHGRVGAIFTQEQRTSLLLTCFTLFRLFCVSATLHIEHIQRFSHILLQKSVQKWNSCGEGEKCNQFDRWPFLDAWICFSYYWPANTPSPSPFCCDRGCALTIQELLRKGAEGNDSHLREEGYQKKKKRNNKHKGDM